MLNNSLLLKLIAKICKKNEELCKKISFKRFFLERGKKI